MSTPERRQHPRAPVTRTATLRAASGNHQRAQLVDLSVSGLGLLVSEAVTVGETLEIQFHLSHGTQSMLINVQGVVRRSHIKGTQVAVGVEVQHIEPQATRLISDFVRYKLELSGQIQMNAADPLARTV